jgi:hypothetical protein
MTVKETKKIKVPDAFYVSNGSIIRKASEREMKNFQSDTETTYENAYVLRIFDEDVQYIKSLTALTRKAMINLNGILSGIYTSDDENGYEFTNEDIENLENATKVLIANEKLLNTMRDKFAGMLPW